MERKLTEKQDEKKKFNKNEIFRAIKFPTKEWKNLRNYGEGAWKESREWRIHTFHLPFVSQSRKILSNLKFIQHSRFEWKWWKVFSFFYLQNSSCGNDVNVDSSWAFSKNKQNICVPLKSISVSAFLITVNLLRRADVWGVVSGSVNRIYCENHLNQARAIIHEEINFMAMPRSSKALCLNANQLKIFLLNLECWCR